jgi:hypothetical protein
VISGLQLSESLAVAPVGALRLGDDLVATAGSWERSDTAARFTPRFAAVPGTEFVVVGKSDDRGATWRELARIRIPYADLVPSTVVDVIDPGVEWVPANLLRFSVAFSSIMEDGSAAGHLHLVDESGADMSGVLLPMPPELWDRSRHRLTVLLEPGRVKRGLQPNEQAGPPLREGASVTLVVDSAIRDAGGAELVDSARRTYRVGAPIRKRVDPALWEVRWPESLARPLVVRFDRPLDRALVQRCLRVLDKHGHPVSGQSQLDQGARQWKFTPAAPAASGWNLHIDTRLEDLAGNSVRRIFDRDLRSAEDDGIDVDEIVLSLGGGVTSSLGGDD